MENLALKEQFLKSELVPALAALDEKAVARWGKMDVRQMIEHMSDYVRIANGRTKVSQVTPEENMPRMLAFLESEKQFRENTPNALLPDTPPAYRLQSKGEAIAELQAEIDHFFEVYQADPARRDVHPFFGALDYDHQLQMLHKHCTHHLRQFGANV